VQDYQTLEQYRDYVVVESVTPGYAHTRYTGYIKKECPYDFTRDELLLLLARGFLPWGGRGHLDRKHGRDRQFDVCVHDD
jgi:hypothetical protein